LFCEKVKLIDNIKSNKTIFLIFTLVFISTIFF
jgi:hypothetical protein